MGPKTAWSMMAGAITGEVVIIPHVLSGEFLCLLTVLLEQVYLYIPCCVILLLMCVGRVQAALLI